MIFYRMHEWMPEIRPAPMSRDWMNATTQGFANRCLPLRIATAWGWEVVNPFDFTAVWAGFDKREAILFDRDDIGHWVRSHFGYGILTFNMHFLLRTENHIATLVRGPANEPRDGIAPLEGIVETGWSHMTFTMNWKFTRPNVPVTFRAGDAICQVAPVNLANAELAEPEVRALSENPKLEKKYNEWGDSRDAFHAAVGRGEIDVMKKGWQGDYLRAAVNKSLKLDEVK